MAGSRSAPCIRSQSDSNSCGEATLSHTRTLGLMYLDYFIALCVSLLQSTIINDVSPEVFIAVVDVNQR